MPLRRLRYQPDERVSLDPLLLALLLSGIAHLVVLLGVTLPQPSTPDEPLLVSLFRPEPVEPKRDAPQIVSPPDLPEEIPKVPTNKLSDKDAAAPREQIRRGLPAPPPQPSAPKLELRNERLLEKFASSKLRLGATGETRADAAQENQKSAGEQPRRSEIRDYRPFQQNNFDRLFESRLGVPDHLPNIPDGDVTLLNAKAYRYAVFVRRVALQVFGALRRHNWQEMPHQEVRRIGSFAVVQAILNPKGELLDVKVVDSSGSRTFDKVLFRAAQDGAWDQNPPAGAVANDGFIKFHFEAKTWSRRSPDGMHEQRWILLGTGLL